MRSRKSTSPSEDRWSEEVAYAKLSGCLLVLLDALNWLFWIIISAWHVHIGEYDVAVVGFAALTSPHTVIIPSLIAMITDLHKHCRPDGRCLLETPHLQWYVFPLLVIPLDALALAYNVYLYGNVGVVTAASVWALVNSVLVCTWSFVQGWKMWNVYHKMVWPQPQNSVAR
jgi:hypothetical protein